MLVDLEKEISLEMYDKGTDGRHQCLKRKDQGLKEGCKQSLRVIILSSFGEIVEKREILLNQADIRDPDYWKLIAMVISILLILKELR